MNAADAAQQVLELYPQIYFAAHQRHVRDPVDERVLSAHQASILSHLDEDEAITLSALAEHMGVTLSTMSLNVKRLVAGGYVERQQDRADRRQVGLRLTEAGVRMKEAQTVLDAKVLHSMLARLSDDERTRALEGLQLLARAAREEIKANPAKSQWGHRRSA